MPRPDFALPEMMPELPVEGLSVTFTAAPIGAASVVVPQTPLPWTEIVLALLLAGWVWRLLAARRASQALRSIVARSQIVVQGPAMAAIRIWSQQLGLKRRPELRFTEAPISPFSYGVARSVICLPDGIEQQLSPPALDLVVGHECLHVARGDGWRRPLERVFADLLWFNPFAWRMRRELDLARELACDEAVLDRTTAPGDYARVLRDVAGLASGLEASAPAASMSLSGGGRVLVMRVRGALDHAKRKPGRAAFAGVLFLALAGAPVAIAQAVLAAPHAPPSAIAPPAPPAQPGLIHGIAPPAPPPAPRALAIAPAAPPTIQERIYVSADGLVRAAFPARITSTGGDPVHGYRVKLVETSKRANGQVCSAKIEGLTALSSAKGQTLTRGQPIGERGKLNYFSITTTCSDEQDAQGRPVRYAPPAPPAAFASQVAPAAPAPPSPLTPPPAIAPLAPVPPPMPVAPIRSLIRAPFAARVTTVASNTDLGLYVILDQIDTPQGFGGASAHSCMVEAPHLSKASVKQGQSIRAGELIGERANGDGNITAQCKSFDIDQVPGPTTPAASPPSIPSVVLAGADRAVLDPPAHLSSGFGFRTDPFTKMAAWHEGVDLASPLDASVHTPVAGKVTFAGQKPGYNNVVEISAANDYKLRLGHLGALSVKEGDVVVAGDMIGTVGMDDKSTGPHVHFEVWWKGRGVDPQQVKGLSLIAAN